MRKIYNYNEFRINEEFLGKLVNFFKGFFKKIASELQKLENDPNKIKDYLVSNVIPSLFKTETDNFRKMATSNVKNENRIFEADEINTTGNKQNANKKVGNNQQNNNQQNQQINQQNKQTLNQTGDEPTNQPQANSSSLDEKAFGLVDAILNKDTGVLGKQGIGMLFNDRSLQGDNMKVKRLTIEYVINNTRDQLANTLKYNQKKNITRSGANKFADMNYLPTFKEMLSKTKDNNTTDRSQNVENIVKWIETNMRDVMINNIKAIKEDDIKAYIQKNGASATNNSNFAAGDVVRYKMDGFIEGTLPDQQKDKIGQLPIERVDGDNYIFKDKNGKEFTKTKAQIIGKPQGEQGNEQDGAEVVDKLKKELGQIKGDPKKMAAMNVAVNLVNQPGGIDKINNLAA
jgi:hypothetical protein